MLSSEISLCLAVAVCFMLVKCVGSWVQGFGDIEVVARGFTRLSCSQLLFYSQVFHALGSYYLTSFHTHTHTHAHMHYTHAHAIEAVVCRAYMGTDWSLCFPSFSEHTDSPKWKSKVVCVCNHNQKICCIALDTHRLSTSQ